MNEEFQIKEVTDEIRNESSEKNTTNNKLKGR